MRKEYNDKERHKGNNLLPPSTPRAAAVTKMKGNDLSLSLYIYISCTLCTTIFTTTTTHENMCPKSYLYIYDFSAYLHLCPSTQSEPIGAGFAMSRFSASSIRRDMFPNRKYLLPTRY